MSSSTPHLTAGDLRSFRILRSGLGRHCSDSADLPIWDLGLQDSGGSARLALANRLTDPASLPTFEDPGESAENPAASTAAKLSAGNSYAMAWTLRGSPHLHRRSDLTGFASALWPANSSDAAGRLSGSAKRLRDAGADPMEAYEVVAAAMRQVVTAPMTKGASSAAVTAAVPDIYSGFCAGCRSVHVFEMLFRSAALPAALGIVPDTKPLVLAPLTPTFAQPEAASGAASLVNEYFRMYGAGTAKDIATHLGTTPATIKADLADAVPVTVDGRASLASAESLAAMQDYDRDGAQDMAAGLVRLLGLSDPLLHPRDRGTFASELDRQKTLWPVLGAPGALLAGGGVAGFWRPKAGGKKLTITVTLWEKLSRAQLAAVESEAQLIGRVRGYDQVQLTIAE